MEDVKGRLRLRLAFGLQGRTWRLQLVPTGEQTATSTCCYLPQKYLWSIWWPLRGAPDVRHHRRSGTSTISPSSR
jgi:hypothetical protein